MTGNIYAGFDGDDTSTNDVKTNSVAFSGGGDVTGIVYGTNLANWNDWSTHGNILGATGGLTEVGGIANFQTAGINSPAHVNVRGNGIAGTDPDAALFHDLNNDGFLSFHNGEANQGVGRIKGEYTGGGRIGLEIVWNEGTDQTETDSVIFENAPDSTVVFDFKALPGSVAAPYADNDPNSLFATVEDGGELKYATTDYGYGVFTYAFKNAGDDYFVGLTAAHAGEIGKVVTDGGGAGLASIAMLGESFLRDGLEHAVCAIDCRLGYGISASVEYASRRFDTGGRSGEANLHGVSGLVTFARTPVGTPISYGIFGEMFDGTYKTSDTMVVSTGTFRRNAEGNLHSYGGGLFFQYRQCLAESIESNSFAAWSPGLHLEATARAGYGVMDFSLRDAAVPAEFGDKGAVYYGAALGGGYVFLPTPKFPVEVYGHGIWTRQGGRTVTERDGNIAGLGKRIEFEAADSLRFVAGVRAAYAAGDRVRPYVGLAADYEAMGRPGARVDGYRADRADFSGLSGLIELGVGLRAGESVFIDAKVSGSVGTRRSISGLLEARYEF